MEGKERPFFRKDGIVQNTIGGLDGKHVAIRRTAGGGSMFYNSKKYHLIVLLALADGNYQFIWVDVGANGA